MRDLVLFGSGDVHNQLFPDQPGTQTLVFMNVDWDFGEGALFSARTSAGTAGRLAAKRGPLIGAVAAKYITAVKGRYFGVLLPGNEADEQEAVLRDVKRLIKKCGDTEPEFLDTREADNEVLLSLLF